MKKSAAAQALIIGGAFFLSGSNAHAQTVRPVMRIDPGPLEANALKTAVDLVVKDVGLGGLGEFVFTLQNRGAVGINPQGRLAAPLNTITTPPIRIDLYFGGTLMQSVYQKSLRGKEAVVITALPVSNVPKCNEARTITVVVDPANQVPELHDDNNKTAVTVPRPCPDLAVAKIEREKDGIAGETYRVKVTVINKGGAPSPADQAWGTSMTSAPGLNGWPEMVPMHMIPALAPGETHVFRIGGSVLSVAHSWVEIFLDINRRIEESDETNNFLKTEL